MGNRAVICLKDNNDKTCNDTDLGIYLHWSGSPEQVEQFLKLTRERMEDRLGDIVFGKARLVGVIHEQIDGNLSLGLDLCQYLDTHNFNNGTYVVNCKDMTITTQLWNHE